MINIPLQQFCVHTQQRTHTVAIPEISLFTSRSNKFYWYLPVHPFYSVVICFHFAIYDRLFIILPIFPRKIAVFQLSLNPSLKVSFTLLSFHSFPLVSPAVSHSKLSRSCCGQSSWPYTYPIIKSTGWQKQQDACPMQWKARQESRAPSQLIHFHPQQGRSDAWHCPCYHKPDWYPFNICMLISAQEPYVVYAS